MRHDQISPDFTPGEGKGHIRTLNSRSYMRSTVHHREPVEIFPKTLEEKQIITNLCNGEINAFIKYAKADGNYINAKGVSDGYHTFQELYDMRLALTRALLSRIHYSHKEAWDRAPIGQRMNPFQTCVWRSRQHSDGTMFDGMFIVGVNRVPGLMITFHYHDEHWDKFSFAETMEKAPEWDGHTDKDVIERLLTL